MSLSTQIKPISYLKSHAAEIVKDFATNPEPLIITQNGEAKMVVMDIAEYERQQETFALLKLVSMGQKELAQGRVSDMDAFLPRWINSHDTAHPNSGCSQARLSGDSALRHHSFWPNRPARGQSRFLSTAHQSAAKPCGKGMRPMGGRSLARSVAFHKSLWACKASQ
ncbi:type II toxin-antitoxin system Phd/YefM family antitoxin [Limnohabitans sp. Bal53]|uniref:type II toxin-antitoxin system Phd/YefM family antitoxin n=1 Tax=Limnohabitans sp. Bal53 TaxID=1977910 RepID=UPI000D37FD3B|nr:hypothetical protein B9Z50_08360 [Limnohabitans sp. Bal53]